MHAFRIEAIVSSDHTVTIRLPKDIPVGPAEVILLYKETQDAPLTGNGASVLRALSECQHPSVDFWKDANQEISRARDDWDES